ncbi:MAG TPA: mechanosensitive ion channel family protein [Pyrinomonadaceae bacterium]|jgi:small-conductance mechanosensitive channel/CRP-like cAMP-binding protein|nr:mechanosensitive ion channel family protein [Pyrinomonadaceae bacterium]
MNIPEFRKRLLFTIAAILIITGILFILPLVEPIITDNVRNFLQSYFVSRRTGEYSEARGTPFMSLYFTILKVIRIGLGLVIVVVIVRLVTFLIFKRETKDGQHQNPTLMRNIFSIAIYIIALFTLVKSQYPGVDLTSLFATSTILGLVIGLALQDTLGNLFAGLATQADEPFKVGDVINIPGKGTGVVEGITWRGVKIRTFANRLLIISNAVLGKETIEVAPRENLNARLVNFSTRYNDSPAKTVQTVRDLVRQCENVSSKIRPIVRIRDLGESGLDWEVKFWLEDYSKYNDTDALVRQRIWYAFQREGIGIPFPTRTLELQIKGKEELQVDTTENGIYDRLNQVNIFTPLSNEETLRLSNAAVKRVFAPKEAIVRMGEEGHSMFVVHNGSVNIQLGEQGQLRNVTTLHEGDIFGEMCLFTGQPRSATVTAAEETEVLEIGHFALKPLFENNPDLAEAMSKTIAERRAQLTAKKEEGFPTTAEEESKGIFNAIKNFFRLEQK